VFAASTALGILVPASHVAAADRRGGDSNPSPYAMPGSNASGSTSGQANYQANYHADYSLKANQGSVAQPDEPRDNVQRDTLQRDWRGTPTVDRYGRGPQGWPR